MPSSHSQGSFALIVALNVLVLTVAVYSKCHAGCFFLGGVVYAWTIGTLYYGSPPDENAGSVGTLGNHGTCVSAHRCCRGDQQRQLASRQHQRQLLRQQTRHLLDQTGPASATTVSGLCKSKCPITKNTKRKSSNSIQPPSPPAATDPLQPPTTYFSLRALLHDHPLRLHKLHQYLRLISQEAHLQTAAVVTRRRLKCAKLEWVKQVCVWLGGYLERNGVESGVTVKVEKRQG